MTGTTPEFQFGGLWFVLSGEFRPPQDPRQSLHTLGHLEHMLPSLTVP